MNVMYAIETEQQNDSQGDNATLERVGHMGTALNE